MLLFTETVTQETITRHYVAVVLGDHIRPHNKEAELLFFAAFEQFYGHKFMPPSWVYEELVLSGDRNHALVPLLEKGDYVPYETLVWLRDLIYDELYRKRPLWRILSNKIRLLRAENIRLGIISL